MKTRWPVLIILMFLLTGCAASGARQQTAGPASGPEVKPLAFDSRPFGDPQDVIAIEDIYRLSDEQQADFLNYFHDPALQDMPEHERVWKYLQDITTDFNYQGETFTAEEALRKSSGNCLSLAVLTTALAELAGIDTGYQLVDSTPVFESRGNIVYRAEHVRTMLYRPLGAADAGTFLLRRGGLLVDYFPRAGSRFVSNLKESQYHAMFYNNLAGEAIAGENYDRAFWLLLKALELAPDNASSINAMAILYRRTGNLEKAEEIYQYGISNLEDRVSLLRNYRVLLEQQDREDEVKKINRALAQLDDPSPFDWIHAGHTAFSEGQFSEAVMLYKKAARIAPYLHESYAGMAKAYYMIGDRQRATREFEIALQHSKRLATRSMYEAKLLTLNSKQ